MIVFNTIQPLHFNQRTIGWKTHNFNAVLNHRKPVILVNQLASVDEEGIESLFSREITISPSQLGIDEHPLNSGLELKAKLAEYD